MDNESASPTFLDKLSPESQLRHGWNAFQKNKDPALYYDPNSYQLTGGYPGMISYQHPDHRRYSMATDKTILVSIFNRIVLDVAMTNIRHVRQDENGTFQEIVKSGLNDCLCTSANIDQSGFAFRSDLMMSMLDEGVVAAVPVDTTVDPNVTGSYDIQSLRVGKIVSWRPNSVRIQLYNDRVGKREEVTMDKSAVAIIENPFYSVMNEPISMLKRLTHKLSLIDIVDEQNSSGKLDMIIQLPYTIKTETKQRQADERRRRIEEQLEGSKLGIAYIDSTERITQLNRPVENQLMTQIEYYTSILYGQLGINQEIMNGTASEEVMQNYYKRTIDVFLKAICDEFERKFLTKTARTQGQAIQYFRDPFSLTPTTVIADIADKFTRNEILSPNEMRGVVGFMPSPDEAANELRNRNLSQPVGMEQPPAMSPEGDELSDEGSEPPLTDEFEEDPYEEEMGY